MNRHEKISLKLSEIKTLTEHTSDYGASYDFRMEYDGEQPYKKNTQISHENYLESVVNWILEEA